MGDSDLVVVQFLESYKLPRIASWLSSVTWGRQHAKQVTMVANSLGSCRFGLQLCKEGVGDVSEQSPSCARRYGHITLCIQILTRLELPGREATMVAPPASSNPAALWAKSSSQTKY